MERLLLIDDDTELAELVVELLEEESFLVETCHNGTRGLERARAGGHALVILDVMLPGMSGLEVLKTLRAEGNQVPVLMLTARGGDASARIQGLELGADDYLPKPFHPRELVARIRAVLRRRETTPTSNRRAYSVGAVTLDLGARTVLIAGEPLALTAIEFDLLAVLLRDAGQIVSRNTLAQAALGRDHSPFDRSIDMHIANLRKKLGDEGEAIKTVRSMGYQYALTLAQAA
jgi:DNA-binding response OmpR family regulator